MTKWPLTETWLKAEAAGDTATLIRVAAVMGSVVYPTHGIPSRALLAGYWAREYARRVDGFDQ